MENINFAKLLDESPIDKLSSSLQSKLCNRVQKEFNNFADAATHEGIHKTAMSRITRTETPKGDYYYSLK